MKKLILFDFDGTLTSKDTLFEIARFSTSSILYKLNILQLLPTFALMKLKWISAQRGKEIFLKKFFGQMSPGAFEELCQHFCKERLPSIIRPLAIKEIEKWQNRKAAIYIVSASPENWIKPWASALGIHTIATQLDQSTSHLSGKISGQNCNYEEKVKRIKNEIALTNYEHIVAYGDSKGDLPMLQLANTKHFKPFT